MINKKGKITKCSGKLFLLLLIIYLCFSLSVVHVCEHVGEGLRKALALLRLEVKVVWSHLMWVLEPSAGLWKGGQHACLWHCLSSPFLYICWEKSFMWPRLASNLLLSQLSWPLPPKCWDSWNVHHNWIVVLRITPKTLCILGKNSTNGLSSVFKLYTTITHDECNHKEVLYKIFCKTVKAYVELLILCPVGAFLWHSTDKKVLL